MTGSVAPGSHIQTKASPADATSEVILHLGSRLVNGLGKQAQLRFLLGEMSSETVPVAVEPRDPDDRCRLEDKADGAARVTLLDKAHHVARHATPRAGGFKPPPPPRPPGRHDAPT